MQARQYTFESSVTSADWLPDGSVFVIATQDVNHALTMYNLATWDPIYTWSKPGSKLRVNDCSVATQGDRLVVVTTNNHIITYNLATKDQISDWELSHRLHGISYSKDGKSLLVSVTGVSPVLLDSTTGKAQRVYSGCPSYEMVVRARFGGADENFIISGSEKSHVHIWRKQTGAQVAVLSSTKDGASSSVAWHPRNPAVFATAGDDAVVKM